MSLEAKIAIVFGIALFLLAIAATVLGFREVQFAVTSLEQVAVILLAIGLVAVIIERAVEVYVSKRYDPEKARLRRPLSRAEVKIVKTEQALAEERQRRLVSSRSFTTEEQEHLQKLIREAEQARAEYDTADEQTWLPLYKLRASKIRTASFLSLAFGALASLCGVRVLGQFLPTENGNISGTLAETSQAFQLGAFRVTDVILTALLLAGGADGIHKIISSFKSFRTTGS